MALDLGELMDYAASLRASDIFLKEGVPPSLRVHGHIQGTEYPALSADEVRRHAYSLMRPEQIAQFEKNLEMDLAFTRPGLCRFRGSIYMQRGSVGVALRLIPLDM